MKFRNTVGIMAACLLVAAVSVKPAMAYFTDTTIASGRVKVAVGNSTTTTTEENTLGTMEKKITISNDGDYDIYLRVKAICGSNAKTSYKAGEDWDLISDGTYEYKKILKVGETTSMLNLSIEVEDSTITNDFNVIIVQEATKVLYDENGNPYADWDAKVVNEQKGELEDVEEN